MTAMDESDLLVEGVVDALFHAAEPKAFVEGNPLCVRLFLDSRSTEQAYFTKTGIYPIMHAVAIRRDVVEAIRFSVQTGHLDTECPNRATEYRPPIFHGEIGCR